MLLRKSLIICIGLLCFTNFAWANVAYVDIKEVLGSVPAGKRAKKILEKEFNAKKKSLEKQEKNLQKMSKDLEKKKEVLSEEIFASKRRDLEKEFLKYRKKTSESQLDIQKRERKLTVPILKNIRTVIEDYAKKKKYLMVLEKQGIVWGVSSSEITKDIIRAYKKRYKSK